ncbi:MAG: glycosyltransferase involved in cell wall biosynthesis [Candidatus Nitrosomirales archaeon]|jgi:glycosyltransferase involved in cell wall biosynthesis
MSIAVIVPARNEEGYVRQTLDSLLDQTTKPDEIIVVLDRCNDKTPEIVKEYTLKHKTIKSVDKHYSKYGSTFLKGFVVAETINEGIKHVSSDVNFIMIANADSVYSDNYIEEALDVMKRENDCVIVGFKDDAAVSGSGAFYRRSFLLKVTGGFFRECAAEDTFMQFAALNLDYKIIGLEQSKFILLRERGVGSASEKIKYSMAKGYAAYTLGTSFWYIILRAGFWFMRKRFSAIGIPMGFIYASLTRAEKLNLMFPDAAKRWQKMRIHEVLKNL